MTDRYDHGSDDSQIRAMVLDLQAYRSKRKSEPSTPAPSSVACKVIGLREHAGGYPPSSGGSVDRSEGHTRSEHCGEGNGPITQDWPSDDAIISATNRPEADHRDHEPARAETVLPPPPPFVDPFAPPFPGWVAPPRRSVGPRSSLYAGPVHPFTRPTPGINRRPQGAN